MAHGGFVFEIHVEGQCSNVDCNLQIMKSLTELKSPFSVKDVHLSCIDHC